MNKYTTRLYVTPLIYLYNFILITQQIDICNCNRAVKIGDFAQFIQNISKTVEIIFIT